MQTASGSSAHCQEGRAEGHHHHSQPSPQPIHSGKNPNQAASASLTRNHSLLKTLGPACPCSLGLLSQRESETWILKEPRAPCLSCPLLGGPEERSTRGVSLALIPVGIPGLPGGLTWTVSMTTEKEWSWQSWASRYWQTPLKVKCLSSKLLKWDCPVIRHSPGETEGRGEWVSQWVPWGTGGKGEGVSQQDSWEDRGRGEWVFQQVLWGDKEEGRVGAPEGSLGKQGGRERGCPSGSPGGCPSRGHFLGFSTPWSRKEPHRRTLLRPHPSGPGRSRPSGSVLSLRE